MKQKQRKMPPRRQLAEHTVNSNERLLLASALENMLVAFSARHGLDMENLPAHSDVERGAGLFCKSGSRVGIAPFENLVLTNLYFL